MKTLYYKTICKESGQVFIDTRWRVARALVAARRAHAKIQRQKGGFFIKYPSDPELSLFMGKPEPLDFIVTPLFNK